MRASVQRRHPVPAMQCPVSGSGVQCAHLTCESKHVALELVRLFRTCASTDASRVDWRKRPADPNSPFASPVGDSPEQLKAARDATKRRFREVIREVERGARGSHNAAKGRGDPQASPMSRPKWVGQGPMRNTRPGPKMWFPSMEDTRSPSWGIVLGTSRTTSYGCLPICRTSWRSLRLNLPRPFRKAAVRTTIPSGCACWRTRYNRGRLTC
jgi:hypothetical protein